MDYTRYAMAQKNLQVRLDAKLKQKAEKVFQKIGIDTPTAIRIFFAKVVEFGGIPFILQSHKGDRIRTENGFSVDEEELLLRDAQAARAGRGVKRYKNVDDLFRAAYADADHRHAS